MKAVLVVWLVIAAMLMAGCACSDTVRGGGWLMSEEEPSVNSDEPEGKITFAFSGVYNAETGLTTGKVQWNDHARDVQFHGTTTSAGEDLCALLESPCLKNGVLPVTWEYLGDYWPQPKGEGGTFAACAFDCGEGNGAEPDVIAIELYGGDFDGYSVSGALGGGNLQWFETYICD